MRRAIQIDAAALSTLLLHVINGKDGKQKTITEFHYKYLTYLYDKFSKCKGTMSSVKDFCEEIGFQRSMWYHIAITYYGSNEFFRTVLGWAYYAETNPAPETDPQQAPTAGDPDNPEWE